MGDLGAAVVVGGGLGVGVDLDSLKLLGNPGSWRQHRGHTAVSHQTHHTGNSSSGAGENVDRTSGAGVRMHLLARGASLSFAAEELALAAAV